MSFFRPNTGEERWRLALAVIGALTLARILVLILSPIELYPDEAQYWYWAQTPALGYFSKPPLIGWIIWLTTAIFGDGEWAVRLSSPLLHAGTALLLFGVGRLTFDSRVGFWSAITYALLPGTIYSSGLVSTDVPLLFCWALALYALLRAMNDEGWRWTLVCAAAIGVGMLAKYAMLYFVGGAILAAVFVPKLRPIVLGLRGLAILAIGFLIFSPNLFWNWQHHFPTVAHTEANANWGHARFSAIGALNWFGGQFGVFGPLTMIGYGMALWRFVRTKPREDGAVILAAISLPPLVTILCQSFISDANANWAATAYVAAVPLAVAWLLSVWKGRLLWVSLALGAVMMAGLSIIYVSPPFATKVGVGNAFKRQQGWSQLGDAVVAAAKEAPYDAIAVANRSVVAELTYYARARTVPLKVWDNDLHDDDHFQMTMRLPAGTGRVLLVLDPRDARPILQSFDSVSRLKTLVIGIGGHRERVSEFYDAHFYRGPQKTP